MSSTGKTFVIHTPEDFRAVEEHILHQLGCSEGRCMFFRTQDFVLLRRQAIYGVRRADPIGPISAIACASNGLFVYLTEPNCVGVSWELPQLTTGLIC